MHHPHANDNHRGHAIVGDILFPALEAKGLILVQKSRGAVQAPARGKGRSGNRADAACTGTAMVHENTGAVIIYLQGRRDADSAGRPSHNHQNAG